MDRRDSSTIVAENILASQNAASVQSETGYQLPNRELTFGDLLDAGGVLCVSPASFMKGVPSA